MIKEYDCEKCEHLVKISGEIFCAPMLQGTETVFPTNSGTIYCDHYEDISPLVDRCIEILHTLSDYRSGRIVEFLDKYGYSGTQEVYTAKVLCELKAFIRQIRGLNDER